MRRIASGTIPTRPIPSRTPKRFGRAIEDLRNDYFEDPTWGMNAMRSIRDSVRISKAANTVVVNFEQFAANVIYPAVDVILLDATF